MTSRRNFLRSLAAPMAVSSLPLAAPRAGAWESLQDLRAVSGAPATLARDEDYWVHVQQAFTVDRSVIHLNNGGVSPAPKWVQDSMKQHLDFAQRLPARHLWTILEPRKETVRARLARQWQVDTEEIALTRNASEGLQILQFGHDLQPGDAVLTTTQDYPRMIATFEQRQRREGIRMIQVPAPGPQDSLQSLVDALEQAILDDGKVKLVLVSHMTFTTGSLMPVAAVVKMARRHGVPVLIDGAHAFAQLDFTLKELDCDYYATSLHKWLCAPHGTGMLYVRRDKIGDLWSLMASSDAQKDNIRKYEEIGTHPAANALSIAEALTFHQAIGGARKQARLTFLRDRWAKRLLQNDRVKLHTSLEKNRAVGIANVALEGIDAGKLRGYLWNKHKIFTTSIGYAECPGLRVSPSVYTTLEEIDRFAEVMEDVLKSGLPK
jgi:selenocysteine lyase/cysteine desulfurase